jgi:hypothetical protein
MLIAILGFGSIWTVRPASLTRGAAYFNTTGILVNGKWRHRSCLYGYIRVDSTIGSQPVSGNRAIHRTFESEPVCEWQGKRKLFLKNIAGKTRPDRYLANLSSGILGWVDRDTEWMCEAGELLSFSEGNGEQEALVVLPPYGWIRTANGSFSLQPKHERPWMAQFHRI